MSRSLIVLTRANRLAFEQGRRTLALQEWALQLGYFAEALARAARSAVGETERGADAIARARSLFVECVSRRRPTIVWQPKVLGACPDCKWLAAEVANAIAGCGQAMTEEPANHEAPADVEHWLRQSADRLRGLAECMRQAERDANLLAEGRGRGDRALENSPQYPENV